MLVDFKLFLGLVKVMAFILSVGQYTQLGLSMTQIGTPDLPRAATAYQPEHSQNLHQDFLDVGHRAQH